MVKTFEDSWFEILDKHTLYEYNNDHKVKIINYSNKAIGLIGTKDIYSEDFKAGIKNLKGVWSKNTKIGNCWVFKKEKLEELKKYLEDLKS